MSQCNNLYSVRSGDTCINIAKNAAMSFPSFIALNKPIDCMALHPGQTLCLGRAGFSAFPAYYCNSIYTMPLYLESCDTVAAKNKITLATLFLYNPGLDCMNLQKGQEFCIDVANFNTIYPTSLTYSTGSNTMSSQCNNFYSVKWGDTCINIAKNSAMSFPSFIALNKPIDCMALQPGQTLCLGRPGFSAFPAYYCNSIYTMPLYLESCDTVAAKNKITLANLFLYNPGLDCLNLQKGQEFCIDVTNFNTIYPTSLTYSTSPSNAPSIVQHFQLKLLFFVFSLIICL